MAAAGGASTTVTQVIILNDASGGGTAPSITAQPSNQTVTAGATATFTVTATGTGTLTYQWERSTNGGGSWAPIGGATLAAYTTPATSVTGGSANNGDQYRCVVTGDTAPPATSNAATLTVNAAADATPPVITGPTGAAGAASISVNVAENTTACGTWTATDATLPIAWDIAGGADAARFSINPSSGALAFVAAPNFEAPIDAGGNNVYDVIVRARDAVTPTPNESTQSVAVTVTNAAEAPLFIGANIADITTKRGQPVTPVDVSGRFSDPEGAALTFSASPAGSAWPSGLVVSSAGVISGSPNVAPGVYSGLRVRGTDPGGLTVDSNAFSATVQACTLDMSAVQFRGYVGGTVAAGVALQASVSVRMEVFAVGGTLGAPLVTKAPENTDAAARVANISDGALVYGTTYRWVATRQSDSEISHGTVVAA